MTDSKHLTEQQAWRVFDVIVQCEGRRAFRRSQDEFFRYFCNPTPCNHWEFRCLYSLGFGGKIHWDGYRLRASMYSEDYTGDRERVLASLNRQLKEIGEQIREEQSESNS